MLQASKTHINQAVPTPKSRLSLHKLLRRILLRSISLLLFAGIILFISYSYIGSPKEQMLKKQNVEYAKELKELNQRLESLAEIVTAIESRDDEVYRPLYELDPIDTTIRNVGIGGSKPYISLEGYQNSAAIISSKQDIDRLGRKIYVQLKSFKEVEKSLALQERKIASIPAIQPVSVADLLYISSYFGYRDHPKLHRRIKHKGLDFAAHKDSPIYATGNGVVERVTSRYSNYGIGVVLDHSYGYESLYAHMSKRIVAPGDTVKRGQIIGYVGGTGRVTGVHLHYEVLKNGQSINPRLYYQDDLSALEYDAMIAVLSY